MKNPIVITILAVLGGLVLIAALSLGYFISVGNKLVAMEEGVNGSWAQVENVYQRRADLIPNLVNTVKGYAKHEAEVLEEVTKARASVGQIKINSPADLPKFEQSQGALTNALSRLMVISEKYPELKADKNFLELQSQLEGTENRISVERMRFNQTAQTYNTYLRQFPASFVAGMRGFKERPYFQASAEAKTAPKVDFSK